MITETSTYESLLATYREAEALLYAAYEKDADWAAYEEAHAPLWAAYERDVAPYYAAFNAKRMMDQRSEP